MDPNACATTLIASLAEAPRIPDTGDAPDEAFALLGWLTRGGFAPDRAVELVDQIKKLGGYAPDSIWADLVFWLGRSQSKK